MSPDPRCACGRPLAVSWRLRWDWGVECWRHTCLRCAPAPTRCVEWVKFGTGRTAA